MGGEVDLVRWDSMRPFADVFMRRLLSVIASDIGSGVMKWLMVMLRWIRHWRRDIKRSLMVHLWRMVVHSQSQANMMSIVMCLWWYVIVTTVWICVVCIWLLSLRVFFVLHATVLKPESSKENIFNSTIFVFRAFAVWRHLPYFDLTLRQIQVSRQLPTLLLWNVSVEEKFLLELKRLELWIRFALLTDGNDLIWPFQRIRWRRRSNSRRSSDRWSCKNVSKFNVESYGVSLILFLVNTR